MSLQWKCHAEYRTVVPASSNVSEARRRDQGSLVAACRGKILSGCEVEAALEEGDAASAGTILREAKRVSWDGCAPWTAVCRSGSSDVLRFACSQPEMLQLVNRGYPLRVAVDTGFHEALTALLELPNIDPNHGCPLFYAVCRGDLSAVKRISAHPRTSINAFTHSRGTTALCQAILCGFDDIFCSLVAHPRIDVNRGFLLTPLQHCVAECQLSFAKVLLSRPSILVNKALGATLPPLWMSLELGHRDIAMLLLQDTRTVITDAMIDNLESQENYEALQWIADCDDRVPLGRLWRRRRLLVWLGSIFQWVVCIVDLGLIASASMYNIPLLMSALLALELFASVVVGSLHYRAGVERRLVLLRLVPILPLLFSLVAVRVSRLRGPGAVLRRSGAFSLALREIRYSAVRSSAAILLLALTIRVWSSVITVVPWAAAGFLAHAATLSVAGYVHAIRPALKYSSAGYLRVI